MKDYIVSSKFNPRSANDGSIYIYGLICPIENELFYVGKTKNPQTRLEAHTTTNPHYKMLASHEKEYVFKLTVLEEIPAKEYSAARETYWILKTLERGIKLHNKTFPTSLSKEWITWLDDICQHFNWTNQVTVNGRVDGLPIYQKGIE